MFKTNKEIKLEYNSLIIEYDIKSANVSVSREYKLLPDNVLDKISNMEKVHRVIAMGKIMRKNKDFSKTLEKSFNDVVKIFIDQNELDPDMDIISIKRDAIFVLNKSIKKPFIGEHIHFVEKNTYHAYMYIKPFEFYFKNDDIVIKGLSDENKIKHKNGMINIMKKFIDCLERSHGDKYHINMFMKELVYLYKYKELPFDVYREFNDNSMFKTVMFDNIVYLDEINEEMLTNNEVDVLYNYVNLVLPMFRLIGF